MELCRARALAAAAAVITAASAPLGAFETFIDGRAIGRAIAIGRSDQLKRSLFHQAYTIRIGDPVVSRVEVVTEFRRVVLAAEERARLGDALWGAREATEALRPFRGTVAIVAQVTFHPQNRYVSVPPFDLVIYQRAPGTPPLRALDVRALPRLPPGLAPPGSAMLGATVTATFDARSLDRFGSYLAGIFQEQREILRVPIDLGRME